MTPATARVVRTRLTGRRPREHYWAAHASVDLGRRLRRRASRTFLTHLVIDSVRFAVHSVRPIAGETARRAAAAVEWLLRAQAATPDDGVSLGYFPAEPDTYAGWRPSYPETTGYIIPSLLEFANRFNADDVAHHALRMARWEIETQMPSGAVQGGPICPPGRQVAAVFNTGMVLHGYTAAYRLTGDRRFLEAGRRAADFLVSDLDEHNNFRTHGRFVAPHRLKTYNCLCAWALYRFGDDTDDGRYRDAAVRAAEAATREQRANGWFGNNCLTDPEAPLVHTIGYTLQGLLEVGILAGRSDLIDAARRGADPLVQRVSARGFLAGRFFSDWRPAVFSSCLTGNAQLAVVCYRLYEVSGAERYRLAANRLVDYLKALQDLRSRESGIQGAIAGSFPMLGGYMTAGYPNWATKYFLDALLGQQKHVGP